MTDDIATLVTSIQALREDASPAVVNALNNAVTALLYARDYAQQPPCRPELARPRGIAVVTPIGPPPEGHMRDVVL